MLLFIHGGGYVTGSKTFFGQGVGLMETAAAHGIDLVFVSINYRLGLFVRYENRPFPTGCIIVLVLTLIDE